MANLRPSAAGEPALQLGRKRLRFLGLAFSLAFLSIGLRLVDLVEWQDAAGPQNVLAAPAKAGPVTVPRVLAQAERADIVDRNGVVLATNLRVPSVYADPSLLSDKAAAARQLAAILSGVDAEELRQRFESAKRFAWVKQRITPDEQKAVLDLGLPGVGFRTSEHRVYPKQHLASHVLGFVNIDNRGLAGIERAQDQRLRESAGPLALSIDTRIQQVAREELMDAYRRFRAIGANAIVFDRTTGELLAMVSLPDFDPNRVGDVRKVEYLNRNVAEAYELGSVFKILTIAMALDSGLVGVGERFDATGKLQIGRHRIGDDHAKNRWLTVAEIFKYSSNIGTARMAFAAGGAAPLEQFFKRLGFYAPPQIEIVDVVRPRTPRRWAEVTVATTSFGHGIAVTPLQFVEAVGGLIGDGHRVAPTLLKRTPGVPVVRTKLVEPRTAELLRLLMWLTVDEGTGTRAKLDAYLVGGKTGTAEKPVGGRYSLDKVLASFVGAFPIDDPRYVVLVTLDEPQGTKETHGYRYGGWTAAPVVAAIIDRIGPLLGVPPTPPGTATKLRARLAALGGIAPLPGRQEVGLAAGSAGR